MPPNSNYEHEAIRIFKSENNNIGVPKRPKNCSNSPSLLTSLPDTLSGQEAQILGLAMNPNILTIKEAIHISLRNESELMIREKRCGD